jgi:hypothetical protein
VPDHSFAASDDIFAAVDVQQFVAQKTLFMAHQQYLFEQFFNFIGVLANKFG